MASIEENIQRLGGLRPAGSGSLVPMPEEEIAALEGSIGACLPAPYRCFLATYGGCRFDRFVAFRAMEPIQPYLSDGTMGDLAWFYGAAAEGIDSVAENIEAFRDRMPEALIAIGNDGLDGQICLGVTGPERGRVHYWDVERGWNEEYYTRKGLPIPPDLKRRNVHLIAESFEEFFDRLFIRDDV